MRLHKLIEQNKDDWSDISAAARAELRMIQSIAIGATDQYQSGIAKYHLFDIDQMVDKILDLD